MTDDLRFGFGRNWREYVAGVGEKEILGACEGLRQLLAGASLTGRSFLDIGCGSGLMSLAALRLGAVRVMGIDLDPDSVAASHALRARFPEWHDRWEVRGGSILDDAFLATLPPHEIIYSWGVLHHTGAMHRAFDNALARLADGGLLIIAIYNRTATSRFWYHYKRIYNLLVEPLRTLMVFGVFFPRALVRLVRGRHPLKGDRGMNIWYDARDWAGGYPYEYASAEEIVDYFADRGLDLKLLKATRLTGCNEFTFERCLNPSPTS